MRLILKPFLSIDYFFKHSKNSDFGENIAIYQDQFNRPPKNNYALFPESMAHEVTESWYNKKEDSIFENRYPYSQIVWKNSVLIGIGVKGLGWVINFWP